MQAEIVAPTPVVEAVPAAVVTDSSPVAEITPPIAGGSAEAAAAAPAAAAVAAPAEVPAAAPLAGGEIELEGGKRKYKRRSMATASVHVGYTKNCPKGTARVRVYSKYAKKMIKTTRCSRSAASRRESRKRHRMFAGGEAPLEGGRRRRSRSRSRRH